MTLQDTLVISLNESDVEHVALAQLDAEVNIDSEGEIITSFGPGDTFGVWLHLSDNIQFDSVEITHGEVEQAGDGTRTITEQALFASRGEEPDVHTTSVIPTATSIVFYGNEGEPTEVADALGLMKFSGEDIENTPYLADITSNFAVLLFEVTAPDIELDADETYPLSVVFYVSEVV